MTGSVRRELAPTGTLRAGMNLGNPLFAAPDPAGGELRGVAVDVLAGLRPALLEVLHRMPGARLLEGRFMTVNHGLGIPRGREAGAAWIAGFVHDLRRSGFLARAIERHGVQGLDALR